MSELRLAKLKAYVERLRFSEGLPRISVSQSSMSLVKFVVSTPDPLTPQTVHSRAPNTDNPFLQSPNRGSSCTLL
ncbi:hypothetical protein BC831DRAFT_511717 [Entophlyctis helioformis]|nr:hypothetical protein BC831DRAFT_511717 [Entophlyctis helioformis]